jgi:muramoyltetrapeptide carboxypeptidase
VVAPAGPAAAERYAAGLALLRARFDVVSAYDPAAAAARLPYLAAEDTARAAALNAALRDERVSAVLCARGGYGSSRMLHLLDAAALRARRVPLVGFSDITGLHAWAAGLGVPSIHGPVVTQLPALPPCDREALFALLEGSAPPALSGLRPLAPGCATGLFWGGNLSLLAHLCGTPYFPTAAGMILLLEDVGESPYRLDRMLTQLLLAGLFERVAGVVLGEFVACDSAPHEPTARVEDVLVERLGALGIPVAAGLPVGHGARNVALPLGVTARLDADAGLLDFPER